MKKLFGAAVAIVLCAAFASVPVLLHGWEWYSPKSVPKGAVKGTIHLGDGYDLPFVGVNGESDLWGVAYAAWAFSPVEVVNSIHPDPNVNPAIIKWMGQNGVRFAITPLLGPSFNFVVIRENWNGTYSTLYYDGGR
jgi:hypothetical protein